MKISNTQVFAPKIAFQSKINQGGCKIHQPLQTDTVCFTSKPSDELPPKDIRRILGYKHPIRLVFSDIDGTIAHKGKASDENLEAIRALKENNIPIIYATGRTFEHAKRLTFLKEPVDPPKFYITQQGCAIYREDGTPFYENLIETQKALKLVELAEEYHKKDPSVYLVFFFNGMPYTDATCGVQSKMKRGYDETPGVLTFNADLKDMIQSGQRPTKAVFIKTNANPQNFEDMNDLEQFLKKNLGDYKLNVFKSSTALCEVTNANASKGLAIQMIAKELGDIPMEEIASFGDANNDISMMDAGVSVAMSNGTKELKEAAKYITAKPVEQSGFAHAINLILENNKRFI